MSMADIVDSVTRLDPTRAHSISYDPEISARSTKGKYEHTAPQQVIRVGDWLVITKANASDSETNNRHGGHHTFAYCMR